MANSKKSITGKLAGALVAKVADKVQVTNPLTVQTEVSRASADPVLKNRKRVAKSPNALW
jgi:hypothetical protein